MMIGLWFPSIVTAFDDPRINDIRRTIGRFNGEILTDRDGRFTGSVTDENGEARIVGAMVSGQWRSMVFEKTYLNPPAWAAKGPITYALVNDSMGGWYGTWSAINGETKEIYGGKAICVLISQPPA
ncbi:MAG: hypothetical protein AAB759_01240 [Patescibacteria group bacterium]